MKTAQIGEFGEILNFNRRTARDLAFKYVFRWIFVGEEALAEMDKELAETEFKPGDIEYSLKAVPGVIGNMAEIDAVIEENSKGWKKSRISNVCISAMRLAVYEILYMEDIPRRVSINEAVEIVKTYDMAPAASFTNGVLGKIGEPEDGDKE